MIKKGFSIFLFLFIAVIVGILYLNLYIKDSTKALIYSDISQIPKRDVALVLGTAKYVKRGKINYFYKYRIQSAAKLYKSGKVKAILVSGDNASKYYNEPARMRRDLIRAGVPKSKIYLDFAGFSTLDSIKRAQKIFGLKKFTIVSQKFHLERALFIAKANHLNAIGFEAKSIKNTAASLKMAIREYFARVKAFLDVYILETKPKFFGKFEKIKIREYGND